jgi:hypothetical protein
MAIAHRLIPELGLSIVVWHAEVTADDSVDHLVRLAEEPSWPPGVLHLIDMRTVTSMTMPDPELLELLFEGSPWRYEDLDKVVIVAAESLQQTMVQDAVANFGMNVHLFVDVASACTHLRIDPLLISDTLEKLNYALKDPMRTR